MTAWHMTCCFLLIFLAILAPGQAKAETRRESLNEGHIQVRISTEPAHRVIIGQQTRLFVEILTDTWFTKAPSYPELIIEGAIALMPDRFGTNFTERIDGITFAAQRRSYVIFPQRAGRLEIPALRIRLGVSQNGRAGTPFDVHTRSLRLEVTLPAEAEGIEELVTTPQLQVRDEWSRPLEDLRVGDALQRTIRMDADQALGMLLPDLDFEAPPGIAVYPHQPDIKDQINRGQYRGERIESATYILQRPGPFTLPAIELHWFDPRSKTLMTETLEARTFEVGGAVAGILLSTATDSVTIWRTRLDQTLSYIRAHSIEIALMMSFGIGAAVTTLRYLPGVLALSRMWRENRSNSERSLFRELERSIKNRERGEIVPAFFRWCDRIEIDTPSLDRESRKRVAEKSGFADRWMAFECLRYARAGDDVPDAIHRTDLRPTLRVFRRAILTAQQKPPAPSKTIWLNPRRPRA